MPVRLEPFRKVDEDVRERIASPHTNEAAVLHAIVDGGDPATVGELAGEVALSHDAVEGALYRLQRKELVTEEEGKYTAASDDAELLGEALVIPEENLS